MMAMASKRVRSAKWDDAETTLLARLKREAFLRGQEGSHVWHEISRLISGRSAKQCRRRWETLVKVYNHVQEYSTQTGQEHEELDDAELASMRLETAYRREWYMIVQEVCRERKRRRICDGGAAASLSKGSNTPVVMETLLTTRPATTDGPVITSPVSDCENNTKLQSRDTPDFKNQVAQVPISTDPLEDARETDDDVTVKTPPEIECAESQPAHSEGLLDECPNDAQCNGTFDSKAGKSYFEEKPPSPTPGGLIDMCRWMSKMSLSTAETISRKSPSIVSEGMITRQSSDNSIMEALDTNSDLQAASKVIMSPDSDFENITKLQSRHTLDFENHVETTVAISTLVRCAPNSPRRDSMASTVVGWVDATDERNVQVEQTCPELEFSVPESSWPESPRHDRGLVEAEDLTVEFFSTIPSPERFSPENRIQEHQSEEHLVSQSSDVHRLQAKPSKPGIQVSTSTLTLGSSATGNFNFFNFNTMIRTQVIELKIRLCCNGCVSNLRKHIAKVDGIQNVDFKVDCNKVIVTAKAEPEVVLKYAQMTKKKVVLLSPKNLIALES